MDCGGGHDPLLLPLLFDRAALTTFSLIGISIIFSLSYNAHAVTGMLSFDMRSITASAGFLVIHAINIIGVNKPLIPAAFVPLIGGLTGLLFAVLLGWADPAQRRRSPDLIASPNWSPHPRDPAPFFGGEAVSPPTAPSDPVFDWNFGRRSDLLSGGGVTLIAVIAMRPHPHAAGTDVQCRARQSRSVQFVGYDPHGALSGVLFLGFAGTRSACGHQLRDCRSVYRRRVVGHGVVATISAASAFIGPIVGAIFVTFLSLGLSDLTPVWQLFR
jgi:branched-chain amino acid transport system permease protein